MSARRRAFCLTLAAIGLASLSTATGCGSIDQSDVTAITKITYTWYGPYLENSSWGGWTDGTIQWDVADDVSDYVSSGGGMFMLTPVKVPDEDKIILPEDFPSSEGGDFDNMIPNIGVAIHVRGSGFNFSGGHWGKNDGIATNNFEKFVGGGVTFFAKLGDDPYATEFLSVSYDGPPFQPAKSSSRAYSLPEDIAPAGPPPPTSEGCAASGATKCYDVPFLNLPLRRQWHQYVLPFSAFAQQGYGLHIDNPEQALVTGANIWIAVPRAVRFDVWLTGFGLFTAANNPFPE
jgi:hypothetical protein